jgi:hypothetical protein
MKRMKISAGNTRDEADRAGDREEEEHERKNFWVSGKAPSEVTISGPEGRPPAFLVLAEIQNSLADRRSGPHGAARGQGKEVKRRPVIRTRKTPIRGPS